ncbi:MAG: dephospho-CoA kinase [Nanoarchaeota archaeon]|nr:dephospho-CoA kinase [Nanoarchaeota archaeon]
MIIGITGVFGSGKTAAARLFAEHGYLHVNADEIGHAILNKEPVKGRVINEFGKSILTNSQIDRKKLKNIVFNKPKELAKLNKIIHPAIISEIKSAICRNKNKKIIVDGALIIEAGCLDLFDKLVAVKISKKEQMKRALKKKKYTKEVVENIINSQLSQKEKLKYADIVVDNSGSLSNTKKQVEKIIKGLK